LLSLNQIGDGYLLAFRTSGVWLKTVMEDSCALYLNEKSTVLEMKSGVGEENISKIVLAIFEGTYTELSYHFAYAYF
jgi:hypothetical protein